MCGIVGLYIKNPNLKNALGQLLSDMLITMTDRGPDSAGMALYSHHEVDINKIVIQSSDSSRDFYELEKEIIEVTSISVSVIEKDTHAVVSFAATEDIQKMRQTIITLRPNIRIMSIGESIEIYKEVGLPDSVIRRFALSDISGSHGIGHTRMATESSVTTLGSHPFSTGIDQCLVHNGSLSNHNNLRRNLIREGVSFETENDTEVAAAYISYRMSRGRNLEQALQDGLSDMDGFYTFVVGTKNGFGVLRDPIACKPAVLAETADYVAFGSEYRALVNLPGIEGAQIWEPEPAKVYFWGE